jgi:hypothetical protein
MKSPSSDSEECGEGRSSGRLGRLTGLRQGRAVYKYQLVSISKMEEKCTLHRPRSSGNQGC